MKFILTTLVLLLVTRISSFDIPNGKRIKINERTEPESRETHYIFYNTPLDHFRNQGPNNFTNFYYLLNTDSYQPGGPIFFHVSDLDTAGREYFPFYDGIVYEVAQEVNGAIASGDLRYFWSLIPTTTLSFEDMTYLTIDQILADLTHVIASIKVELNAPTAKVIVFGAGFGGTLATWLRIKFPHLIDAVWSSSGIFSADLFTEKPYQHVSNIIENIGGACASRTSDAFVEIANLIETGQGEYLQELFFLCSPVDTTFEFDIQTFYEGHLNFISHYFSRNHENAESNFCYYLEDSTRSPIEAYANWYYWIYYWFECIELSYANRTATIAIEYPDFGDFFLVRQWYYLKCTQLGMHQTTSTNDNIFRARVSEDYQYNVCRDVLGDNYNFNFLQNQVDRLFLEYGGNSPVITHAIFTNGLNDPWLSHGILEIDQPNTYVFNMTNVGRAADIYAYNSRPLIDEVWSRVSELLVEWSTT